MAETARTPTPRRSPFAGLLDELVSEILLRLPPKAILRCRAVCRAWRRTTSDRAFLLAHHRRQPPQRLISFVRDVGASPEMSVVDYCLEGLDLRTHQLSSVVRFTADDPGAFIEKLFILHAACDGILLISYRNRLCLCNPATRQWTSVFPQALQHGTIKAMGLYAHGPSGEYRVLYYLSNCRTPMFFINAVGSGKERGFWPDASMRNLLQKAGSKATYFDYPFLFCGNLHWLLVPLDRNDMMVFDTVAEVFCWFRAHVKMHYGVSFLEMEGTLAMSDSDLGDSKVDLWLLQDYKSEVWVHKYRIELPLVEIQRFDENPCMDEDGECCKDWSSQVVSQEGDVLVDIANWLLHYDNKGNMLQKFRFDGRLVNFTAHILKESLIPQAFFGMHQQNARAFEPPFFQWL